MSRINELIFWLIRAAITDECLPDGFSLSMEEWREISALAAKHDVSQLVYKAVVRNKLLSVCSEEFLSARNKMYFIAARVLSLQAEQKKITDVLEENSIRFVLLKGAIMRELYPKAWMRTSCDIDILVHQDMLSKAAGLLQEKLFYTLEKQMTCHDLSLFSEGGIHLELHYSISDRVDSDDDEPLNIWNHLVALDGYSYGFRETPELFILHHITHMAKHIRNGGCGIRPFVDLWVIQSCMSFNKEELDRMFDLYGIERFAETAFRLSRVWMDRAPSDSGMDRLSEYIIAGGCYGTRNNMFSVNAGEGRLRALFRRIFPPYKILCRTYPWLVGRKWLVPVAISAHLLKLLRPGTFLRARKEAGTMLSLSDRYIADVNELMGSLGLL